MAAGENSAVEAAKAAIFSPLRHRLTVPGSINQCTCGSNEPFRLMRLPIQSQGLRIDANIIFGAVIGESFKIRHGLPLLLRFIKAVKAPKGRDTHFPEKVQ